MTAVNLTIDTVSWTRKLPPTWLSRYLTWISPDGLTVYALGDGQRQGPETLYRISAATGTMRGAPIQVAPLGLSIDQMDQSPDGKTLLVQAHTASWTVRRYSMTPIDAATGKAGRAIKLPNPGYLLFGPS